MCPQDYSICREQSIDVTEFENTMLMTNPDFSNMTSCSYEFKKSSDRADLNISLRLEILNSATIYVSQGTSLQNASAAVNFKVNSVYTAANGNNVYLVSLTDLYKGYVFTIFLF